MMNTRLTEDIMARLNKGEDIEAIAREFTESINSANEQYRLAEKAKRAEETRKKNKVTVARELIDICKKIVSVWEVPIEEDAFDANPEDLVDYFDSIIPLLAAQVKLEKVLTDTDKDKTKSDKHPSEAIDQFLNSFVR